MYMHFVLLPCHGRLFSYISDSIASRSLDVNLCRRYMRYR